MPQIVRMTSRVFFMYNGRIESEGDTGEVFSRVMNPHLKQYLTVYGAYGAYEACGACGGETQLKDSDNRMLEEK